ncbi:MAG: BtpA/SgcQ family protein [archaeon]
MNTLSSWGNTPILGMIHLADDSVKRALEEAHIYAEEGLTGIIVENYHGTLQGVVKTMQKLERLKLPLQLGVNILPNEFSNAFAIAAKYKGSFIQLDHVAGTYMQGRLDHKEYQRHRELYPEILVLGGVWPKYYRPVRGSSLERDVQEGMLRADALVITGSGTGKETPLEKIRRFRTITGEYPLFVGAGITPENAYQQLMVADGAIVGSAFKEKGITMNVVNKEYVRAVMSVVAAVRKEKALAL